MESTHVTPGFPEKPEDQTAGEPATPGIQTEEKAETVSNVPEPAPEISMETEPRNPEPSVEEPADLPEEVHPEEAHLLTSIPETHDEIEHEPEENFGTMSKEDLTERMEAFSKETDFNSVKNRVAAAKESFQLIYNQERDAALAKFIADGGVKEEFDYKDPLEEKFFNAYKHYNKRRSEFVLGQEKLRQDNLKAKNDILTQMKNILQQEEDMSKAFNEFHELQAKWRSIGPVPPQHVNDLWMTYKLYSDRFYEFIKINRELQDLEMKKNLEMKMQLCERAEELMLEPSLNKAIQEIQSLQHKWREIGAVPREKRTEIWIRFKAATDKIYDQKRNYLDSMKQQFADNLNAKNELIAKAETLIAGTFEKHTQWQEGLKQLLELQGEWRKIGPAGKEHNDQVWQKFKSTCDQFFRNKDAFYKKKKQEYAANLQLKTELCMQAEAFKESNDWKITGQELVRLQQEWKKIGPAGEKNEKIWQRFKAACDAFFQRKNAHFANQDEQQDENLKKKEELISQVEQFTVNSDASGAIEELKAFQRSFMDIGLVPLAKKDEIQSRFRNAIQKHFDELKTKPEYRQSFRRNEGDRPQRTDRQHHRGDRQTHHATQQPQGSEEQRNLQHLVNKLNSEVQVWENNLGFFAKSSKANALKEEYELKIRNAKDEISKLKTKLAELRSA